MKVVGSLLRESDDADAFGGGSGWEQIGLEITSIGAGPWNFTGIDAPANGYSELAVICTLTVAAGSPSSFRPQFSYGGKISGSGTFSPTTTNYAAGKTITCACLVSPAQFDTPVMSGYAGSANLSVGIANGAIGGINTLGVQDLSSSATVSAMSLKLYAR